MVWAYAVRNPEFFTRIDQLAGPEADMSPCIHPVSDISHRLAGMVEARCLPEDGYSSSRDLKAKWHQPLLVQDGSLTVYVATHAFARRICSITGKSENDGERLRDR